VVDCANRHSFGLWRLALLEVGINRATVEGVTR
jgi:hypothetical protein